LPAQLDDSRGGISAALSLRPLDDLGDGFEAADEPLGIRDPPNSRTHAACYVLPKSARAQKTLQASIVNGV
jgi:hypothetical protein